MSLQKFVWLGPSDDLSIQEDFDKFYSKTVELTSTVYFTAGEAEVGAMYDELAGKRHCFDRHADPMQRMRALLAPGKVCILDAHSAVAPVDEEG